jgi:hypothetical protein
LATFTLLCTFASFCGLSGCPEGQGDHSVRARLDPERPVAEFWTSTEAGIEPWPAILQDVGFAADVWGIFSAGALHGHWMLSVTPATGDAVLSVHSFAFAADARTAFGRCQITEESI